MDSKKMGLALRIVNTAMLLFICISLVCIYQKIPTPQSLPTPGDFKENLTGEARKALYEKMPYTIVYQVERAVEVRQIDQPIRVASIQNPIDVMKIKMPIRVDRVEKISEIANPVKVEVTNEVSIDDHLPIGVEVQNSFTNPVEVHINK